jgi:hypothetical protein
MVLTPPSRREGEQVPTRLAVTLGLLLPSRELSMPRNPGCMPYDNGEHYRAAAMQRSEELLDLLIEHHGNDNATGVRADIPPKIQAQIERRERWSKTK